MHESNFRWSNTGIVCARALVIALLAVGCGEADFDSGAYAEKGLSAGAYTLVRDGSGKCIDINRSGTADGTNIHQWTCNGTGAQIFELEPLEGNTFRLVNPNSGKCLDVNRSGEADGTNIHLWTCNGTEAQSFYAEALEGGFYRLRNTRSHKCVDVSANSPNDGANVQIWTCNGTPAQSFRFELVGPDDPGDPDDPNDPEPPTDIPDNAYCSDVRTWDAAWTDWELEVLQLVNEQRAAGATCGDEQFGPAGALSFEGSLHCAARKHSKDMVERDYFSHTSPEGDGPGDRLDAAGYTGRGWGENIAAGQTSPASAVDAWVNSPGHCRNLMNPGYSKIGVGYYPGGDWRHMWTQTFGN